MKPASTLIFLLAIGCAMPSRALRLEPQPNPTSAPLPVVDIEDASHMVVAHLYELPGETMKLDSDSQKPASGAGYYEAMPGEDYFLLVLGKLQFPRLGKESCPCALHMDKIGWNRQGALTIIAGLRPFLETSSGARIPIVSDVKHPRIANGRLYFKLKGRYSEYWVLTRFGQSVEVGDHAFRLRRAHPVGACWPLHILGGGRNSPPARGHPSREVLHPTDGTQLHAPAAGQEDGQRHRRPLHPGTVSSLKISKSLTSRLFTPSALSATVR
jgi:hypothetical protein